MQQRKLGACTLIAKNNRYEIHLSSGASFPIKKSEYQILCKLLESHPSIVSHTILKTSGWGGRSIVGENSLPVAISNLRKILALEKIKIDNEPGVGYKLIIETQNKNKPSWFEGIKNTITFMNITKIVAIIFSVIFWIEIYELWVFAYCDLNDANLLLCKLNHETFIIKL
ncbi:winged helix-turn-helix domain-containing protein [Vibrio mediterranei]|uniref:winged helix-turn-helix domain-containing protein n=1 Tax=Vibrio mediterranei TaxID=689 RepID=UPI001EFE737E|nr:helix-turn-helix domain-containing protein [Vibrio mediterranei]MCG9660145.1 helix-turn-helix domain-containing protein [Vibrio mediterranei]